MAQAVPEITHVDLRRDPERVTARILELFDQHEAHIGHVAEHLQITRSTLDRWIAELRRSKTTIASGLKDLRRKHAAAIIERQSAAGVKPPRNGRPRGRPKQQNGAKRASA